MYKILFLGLVLSLSTLAATAQKSRPDRREEASRALQDLKNGVLLLRLKSYNRQKEFLQQRHADSGSSESQDRYQEKLKAIEAEQLKWNKALSEAINSIYDYSKVYHVYDTSMYALQKGDYEGRVFTPEGDTVSADALEKEELFILAQVSTDKERGISTEGLAVWRLKAPASPIAPFPYFSKLRYRLFTPMTPEVVTIAHRRAVRRWFKSLEQMEEALEN